MSVFIFIHYTDSHTKIPVFSISIWLLFNCCNICFCNRKGITTFYYSSQWHQSLLLFFLLASTVSCCVLLPPCFAASPVLYMPLAFAGGLPVLPPVFMFPMDVHTGIFTDVLMVFSLQICSSLQFPGACFPCDCSGAVSLQCISLGKICILCAPCTGVSLA